MSAHCRHDAKLLPAVLGVCLMLSPGCMEQMKQGGLQAEPPPAAPVVMPPAPPPAAPEPSPEDLAFEAAGKAASNGDAGRAIVLYEKAAELTTSDDRRAEIHFSLALLHADPASPARDLARGRSELQQVIELPGSPDRIRAARILAALLDELSQLRIESVEQRAETLTAQGELATMKARIDQKEKELAEIKRILLQDKKKP